MGLEALKALATVASQLLAIYEEQVAKAKHDGILTDADEVELHAHEDAAFKSSAWARG